MIKSTGVLFDYKEFRDYGDLFVETGSGHGDGIALALDAGFGKVISIEAQRENFEICTLRFSDEHRVRLVHGTSEEILPTLFKEIRSRMVFYLDAHVSGEKSYGHERYLEGDPSTFQDTIIRKELEIILTQEGRPLMILDDINGHADGLAEQYAELITRAKGDYEFRFYDENRGPGTEHFYKDKLLVAVPT